MKSPILPIALAALALHTSCKPKPAAAPVPDTTAAAAPADQAPPAPPAEAPAGGQASPPQGNAGGNRPGGGPGNFQQRTDERMQRMKTELGLTDDQSQKIRAVFEQQFGALRQQGGNMSREDRRAAFEKARAAANTDIEQILTPEQKPKWEALQQQMQQQRGQRGQGGPGRWQGGNRRNGGGNN